MAAFIWSLNICSALSLLGRQKRDEFRAHGEVNLPAHHGRAQSGRATIQAVASSQSNQPLEHGSQSKSMASIAQSAASSA